VSAINASATSPDRPENSRTLEKLASGLRINRAGDDAAYAASIRLA